MQFLDSILGWIIILGSLIPYGIQYYKITNLKNIDGISSLMLMSGCTSSLLSFLGIISNNTYKIIETNNKTDQYLLTVSILQIATPYILLEIYYLLYFIYTKKQLDKYTYILYHIIQFLTIFVIFPIIMVIFYKNPIIYIVLNILSGIFSILMWIPQIITTLKEKKVGSLSITSLLIQAFGCVSVITFQLIDNTSPTVMIPYVIAIIAEIFLVIICSYYRYKNKKLAERDFYNAIHDQV